MGDPIDDYLNQITGEGGGDTGQGAPPGGGGTATVAGARLTLQELGLLAGRHGGLVGTVPVDPYIKDPGDPLGSATMANPNPTYRYTFADNTYLLAKSEAQRDPNTNQWQVMGVNVAGPSTALAPEKATKPTMTPPGSLDTTEQYYAVWNPDTGDYERRPNPLFDPTAAASRKALDEARLAQAQRLAAGGGADNSVAWARLAWEQQWAPQQLAAEQALKREQMAQSWQQQVADIAAANERNRLNQTVGFTNDLLARWAAAAPSAMIPGQQQFLGFEPGGPYEQLVKMGGGTYNPALYKPAPVALDPGAAWRAAQGMIAGGG